MSNLRTIKIRGDSTENWELANPILEYKEMACEFADNGTFFKIGNGIDSWNDLAYVSTVINDAVLQQDLADPTKGAAMVAYGEGTVADKLDEIVSGAVTEPIVDAKVLAHNHDPSAHPELSAFISGEADRADAAADRSEDAYDAIYNSGALRSASIYETVADGLSSVADDEYFWVYPNNLNSIENLTLFKRVDEMTEELLFVQYNLSEYMIQEGSNWEAV